MSIIHTTRLRLERVAREAQRAIDDGQKQYDEILRGVLSEVSRLADMLSLRAIDTDTGCEHTEKIKATQHVVFESIRKHTGLTYSTFAVRKRSQRLVVPRQVSMWALRTFTGMTLKEIADVMARLDHSTILYGVDCVDRDRRLAANGMTGLGRATLSRLVEADIRGTQ